MRIRFYSLGIAVLHTFTLTLQRSSVTAFQTMSMSAAAASSKRILYDMPVSNNGARCRLILYKKNIPKTEVDIVPPTTFGEKGLKSPEYLAKNPQGKMPLLSILDESASGGGNVMNIPESDTICRYLLSEFESSSPSFLPNNTKSNLISRIHDMYLTTIQGCMYKATPPFGIFGTRQDALNEYVKQLGIIDELLDERNGDDKLKYLCGDEVSLADATLFPSIVFAEQMLPKFGFENPLPDKISSWYNDVKAKDGDFSKVYDEIMSGIDSWEGRGRWDEIFLAGLRDTDPPTIFDKIVNGEIPSSVVYSDDKVLAFKDINPAAPAHCLVIPKDRMNLTGLRKSSPDHIEILGRLLVAAGEVAKDESLGFGEGARVVINDGKDGGQEVAHLHLHVLGGRALTWPPG